MWLPKGRRKSYHIACKYRFKMVDIQKHTLLHAGGSDPWIWYTRELADHWWAPLTELKAPLRQSYLLGKQQLQTVSELGMLEVQSEQNMKTSGPKALKQVLFLSKTRYQSIMKCWHDGDYRPNVRSDDFINVVGHVVKLRWRKRAYSFAKMCLDQLWIVDVRSPFV